ncbi:MAG: hypothetical protein J0L75_08250 [Spirochaetes bacterium]|nr:hypothetical protein [Spirochaetota bacterium]
MMYIRYSPRYFLIPLFLLTFSLAARPDKEEVSIIEFYNSDILSVINYIADVTGYTIVVDPSVRGKVSLSAKDKITVKESVSLIESILLSLGYTLEKTGTILKVVPLKDTSALRDIYTNANLIPAGDNRLVTYIRPIASASGDSLMRTLRPFQSKFGNVIFEPTSKKLILTDIADNVRNISKLIDQLDLTSPVAVAEKVETISEVVTLKNMDLDQSVKLLQASFLEAEVEDARYPAARRISPALVKAPTEKPKIQIIALERKDQLLLVGEKKLVFQVKKTLEELDSRLARPELSLGYEIIRLRYLQYEGLLDFLGRLLPPGSILGQARPSQVVRKDVATAARLKGQVEFITLQSKGLFALVGDEDDRRKVRTMIDDLETVIEKNQAAPVTPLTAPEVRIITLQYAKSKDIMALLSQMRSSRPSFGAPTTSSTASSLGQGASDLIDPAVQLIDHSIANSIIATGPEAKLRVVESLIRRLDIRITQVLIEIKIMEVAYNRNVNLGVDFDNISLRNILPMLGPSLPEVYNPTIRSITHGISGSALSAAAPGVALTFNNSAGNPFAIIQALGQVGNVNLVSTPNLLTMDNKKASINIVDRRAIVKQTVQIADSATAGRDKVITTPEYKDAGLNLTVTPRINDASNVSLDIDLTIDDFKESTTPGFPDISSRKVLTEISVRDRTTAILGGIMKNQKANNATGLPGAVDVPVVRNIFGKTSYSTVKTELLIFLTPYIIYDDETLRILSEKKLMETALNAIPKPKPTKKKPTPRTASTNAKPFFSFLFPKKAVATNLAHSAQSPSGTPGSSPTNAAPSSIFQNGGEGEPTSTPTPQSSPQPQATPAESSPKRNDGAPGMPPP